MCVCVCVPEVNLGCWCWCVLMDSHTNTDPACDSETRRLYPLWDGPRKTLTHTYTCTYLYTHPHTYACQVRYLLEPLIDLVLAGERDLRRGLQVCWEAWCFGDRAAFYGSHCVFFLSKIWFGLLGGFSLTSSSPLDLAKMHLHTMFCSVTSYSNGCEYFLLSSWGSFFEWLLSGFRQDSDRRVQSW